MSAHYVTNLILYLLAALCFLGCTFDVKLGGSNRFHLLGLGVFFWSLVPLIETAHKVF